MKAYRESKRISQGKPPMPAPNAEAQEKPSQVPAAQASKMTRKQKPQSNNIPTGKKGIVRTNSTNKSGEGAGPASSKSTNANSNEN